ncbi:MAG: DUF4388 domain-containing protein [Planctomycetes bacterium]|nr:DUF4388 domain-containing protein [Planctomycetota bacterium]MCB9920419.1 DUF4388 domain-containing protein [Planctomycetota bacterium]
MNATPETDLELLASLVEKCAKLCQGAERALPNIDPANAAFLAHNLEGGLQQVELILRVIGEGKEDSNRDSDRQGFLRRLFARETTPDNKTSEPKLAVPPSFDVAKQGLFGNSWTVGLAELLGFLAFGNKTGVLWVDSPLENFIVQLIDGKLVHATSDHTPEGLRLGEILVGLGYLTRRQLERFLSRCQGESVSGEDLLDGGMISADELHDALTHQVRQLFLRLVQTDNAIFRFSEGMQIELAHTVDLDVNRLLLDSAKEFDEAGSASHRAATVLQEWNAWQQALAQTAAKSLEQQAALHAKAQAQQTQGSKGPSTAAGTPSSKTAAKTPSTASSSDKAASTDTNDKQTNAKNKTAGANGDPATRTDGKSASDESAESKDTVKAKS